MLKFFTSLFYSIWFHHLVFLCLRALHFILERGKRTNVGVHSLSFDQGDRLVSVVGTKKSEKSVVPKEWFGWQLLVAACWFSIDDPEAGKSRKGSLPSVGFLRPRNCCLCQTLINFRWLDYGPTSQPAHQWANSFIMFAPTTSLPRSFGSSCKSCPLLSAQHTSYSPVSD